MVATGHRFGLLREATFRLWKGFSIVDGFKLCFEDFNRGIAGALELKFIYDQEGHQTISYGEWHGGYGLQQGITGLEAHAWVQSECWNGVWPVTTFGNHPKKALKHAKAAVELRLMITAKRYIEEAKETLHALANEEIRNRERVGFAPQ